MARRRLWRILEDGGLETTVVTPRHFRLERATPTTATVYVDDKPYARDVDFDGTEHRADEILGIYRERL